MVNRVILIGNLGKDPEVRRLDNGAMVAKFSIATNENYKDKSGEWQKLTEWHDIVVWRNLAERAESTLKKGTTIYVEGKLTHRKWQDQDGNNRKTTEVVASYFRKVSDNESRREQMSDGGNQYFPSVDNDPGSRSIKNENASSLNSGDGIDNIDDDLPF